MTSSAIVPDQPVRTWVSVAEWVLVAGLAATIAWTTLCLGGYLAATMILVSWLVLGLGMLGAMLWLMGGSQRSRTINLLVLVPLPFLAYALASVFWLAPAKWLAWREWLLWFQMWLVFALALHFGRSRAQAGLLVGTLVALGLTGTSMALYQRFGDASWMMLGRIQADQFVGRSAGMFGIPNSLAALLELLIPGCLLLCFDRDGRPLLRWLSGVLALLFIVGIVLTGSRGGWISLGLALLCWPLLAGRGWKPKVLGITVVLVCVLAGIWALYQGSAYARERIQPFLEGKFESSRPIIWKAGWQMWQEAPWVGRGAAAYNVLFEQYRPRGFLNVPDWTHNDYLNTLIDYGVMGLLLWLGVGLMLAVAAGQAVRREWNDSRPEDSRRGYSKRKLGLFLGLLAFGVHLGVDFHTKLPALAYIAALLSAMAVRDEIGWIKRVPATLAWLATVGLVAFCGLLTWRVATPLYRAEALRYEARRAIDLYAGSGQGDLAEIVRSAKKTLTRAVRLDPANGQAWADLAYATAQNWRTPGNDKVTMGRLAELAADEALQRCPVIAEFWVRKGVALEIQLGRTDAEACFRQAVTLAPHWPQGWYYYAYHLQGLPRRKPDALAAVKTCLALDPYYTAANTLSQQLASVR